MTDHDELKAKMLRELKAMRHSARVEQCVNYLRAESASMVRWQPESKFREEYRKMIGTNQ
jgi:hypothetical protein